MRRLVLFIALATVASCSHKKPRDLNHSLIHVTGDANLRTDTVGGGKFADLSTFVLVEAENTANEGAYVTLGGELADEADHTIAVLRAQSLYVPAGEKRTFALVDRDRKPRPTAKAARIRVRGARVGLPPPAHVEGLREILDGDKMVVQGVVRNEAGRGGNIMVIATFYDREGKPMTRPFSLVWIEPNNTQAMQFVGPPGSTHATMFIGDVVY